MEGLKTVLFDLQTGGKQIKTKEIYQNAIKISYRIESELLIVFVTGQRSLDDTLYYWKKIIELCDKNQIDNVQLTLALRRKFLPFDGIKNYQQVIDFVKNFDINVALIDLNRLSQKNSQVACNMAASQSLNCAYFENELESRAWLNQFLTETA